MLEYTKRVVLDLFAKDFNLGQSVHFIFAPFNDIQRAILLDELVKGKPIPNGYSIDVNVWNKAQLYLHNNMLDMRAAYRVEAISLTREYVAECKARSRALARKGGWQ